MTDVEIRCLFTVHFTTHRDCIQIFTDGSKSDKGVGYAAVFLINLLNDVCHMMQVYLLQN